MSNVRQNVSVLIVKCIAERFSCMCRAAIACPGLSSARRVEEREESAGSLSQFAKLVAVSVHSGAKNVEAAAIA
jgi:hypothetical protein